MGDHSSKCTAPDSRNGTEPTANTVLRTAASHPDVPPACGQLPRLAGRVGEPSHSTPHSAAHRPNWPEGPEGSEGSEESDAPKGLDGSQGRAAEWPCGKPCGKQGLVLPLIRQAPSFAPSDASDWATPSSRSPAGGTSAGSRSMGTLLSHRLGLGSLPSISVLRSPLRTRPRRRRIRWCKRFDKLYHLGCIVQPSCHVDMEVRFAIPRVGEVRDPVVVKVRHKRRSFLTKEEELAWRANTELMLNVPNCSNIVRILDVLEDSTAYYVVMEKAKGLDLFDTVGSSGLLPVEQVKDILRQLLDALALLHSCNIIHKDLKLENVMLDRHACPPPAVAQFSWETAPAPDRNLGLAGEMEKGGTVKLVDFDTVQEFSPGSPLALYVQGSDQYIAPEAYTGQYSPASDIFAVGVIGYKLLTGMFPFSTSIFDDQPGENWVGSPKMLAIADRLQRAKICWDHSSITDQPGARELLSRMLAVKLEDRPSAAEALASPWLRGAMVRPVVLPSALSTESEAMDKAPSLPHWVGDAGRPE